MTRPTPIHTLPENYIEARHVVLTETRILLWLNLASLLPLVIALLVLGWWSSMIQRLRGPYSTAFSETLPWLLMIVVVIIVTFGGHEAIHGLAIRWAGHRPRFGMKLAQGMLYATADNALFPRGHFLIIALAPLVVLTLVGMALMIVIPDTLGYYVGLGVALNAAGSIGDLWMSAEVLRYPPDTLIRDEADSIRIYVSRGEAADMRDNPV